MGETNRLVFFPTHFVYVLIYVFICVRQSPDVTSLKDDLALHSRKKEKSVTFFTHFVYVLIYVFICVRQSPDVTSLEEDLV